MASQNFTPLKIAAAPGWPGRRIRSAFLRLGGALELILILGVWFYLFSDASRLGGFTRSEMVTYLIAGGVISTLTHSLIARHVQAAAADRHGRTLARHPFRYFFRALFSNLGATVFAVTALIAFHVLLIYLAADYLIINTDIRYLAVIFMTAVLAFVSEILFCYLGRFFIFWWSDSPALAVLMRRLKRLLAGNYFPLTLLPAVFVDVSLFFPFAYSFFVPADLYLKKLTLGQGVYGLAIQIFWIIILYAVLRLVWQRREEGAVAP